jgi:cell division transport system permease protein
MMFFLRYFLLRAFKNMKGNLFPNLTTIGIITLSMLIFSTFSLIAFNLSSFLKIWEDKIEIVTYLKKDTSSSDVDDLLRSTRLLQGVESVKYVSSSDAFAFMETKLGSQKDLLEGIQPTILPASFEIQLQKEFRNSTRIKEVVSQLRQFPQMEEIQYGQEWVEAFSVIVHILRITQWILGGLLLAAMTFIVANTLQLTIASRREEIEIMHLVGASPAFIQVPFYVEGIIQGLLGAGLAVLSLFFLHKILFLHIAPSIKEWTVGMPISFLPPKTIASLLSGGMVLGFFGSFVASMRILKYSG